MTAPTVATARAKRVSFIIWFEKCAVCTSLSLSPLSIENKKKRSSNKCHNSTATGGCLCCMQREVMLCMKVKSGSGSDVRTKNQSGIA